MSLDSMLNITCDVYSISIDQDSTGAATKTESIKSSDVPCRIREKSASERTIAGREGVASSHVIYTKFFNFTERDIIKIITRNITNTTIAFVNSAPDTITDSNNGLVAAGFESRDITVSGSANNNDIFTIAQDGISAGTLTLISSDSLTAEGVGATVTIKQYEVYDIVKVGDYARDKNYLKIDVIERI